MAKLPFRKNKEAEDHLTAAPDYDDFIYDEMRDDAGLSEDFTFGEGFEDPRPVVIRSESRADDTHDKFVSREQPDDDGTVPSDSRSLSDLPGDCSFASRDQADEKDIETQLRERESSGSSLIAKMRKKHGVDLHTPAKGRQHSNEKANKKVRIVFLGLITLFLSLVLLCMFFSHIFDAVILNAPESAVARILAPVQSVFSTVTEGTVGYLRKLKLRANIEASYNELRAENERLTYEAMLADELQIRLSQYEDINDEVQANTQMNPITCAIIGRSDNSYFSTLTINKGKRDGIEDYMAVTISGALVGYTENVKETTADVRCIVDSDASIAALIQSSRDQGTVSGTLGIDGTFMCRMYYLSDDHLPRPGDVVVTSGVGMSFPKGIPIGTVRESTRGMESNKQYIVVQPYVDFEHIEYVIVLRYKPAAEAVTGRTSAYANMTYEVLPTARPYPTLRIGGSTFGETPLPMEMTEVTPSPTPEVTPEPTPAPTATPVPTVAPIVYEYHPVSNEPTAVPTETPSPSPTPYVTLDPGTMTYEED